MPIRKGVPVEGAIPTTERLLQALAKHPELLWEFANGLGRVAGPWVEEEGDEWVRHGVEDADEFVATVRPNGSWSVFPRGTLVCKEGVAGSIADAREAADQELRNAWGFKTLL